MIRVQMSGRLGNQLFQWAYSHKLAATFNTNVELVYDTFNYTSISQVVIRPDCCLKVSVQKNQLVGLATSLVDKYHLSKNRFTSHWLHSQLDPYVLPSYSIRPKVVRGYFTTAESVTGVEDHLSDALEHWITSMIQEDAISQKLLNEHPSIQVMHVRRGDFLQHSESIGVLATNYYEQHRNWNEPLIIVTDSDSELPELNSVLRPNFTLHQQNSSIFDSLNLMRNAKSLVLSNSTFSWWGGFLAELRGARVYCPEPFFKRDELVNQAFLRKGFNIAPSFFY